MPVWVYRILADVVVTIHASYIAYVVIGLLVILVGLAFRKAWARNFWFRISHLACIGIVVLQAWFGVVCPLTTLEKKLRVLGGQPGYSGTFIGHWMRRLIFFRAEPWVFVLCYTIFGTVVLLTFVLARPRLPGRNGTKPF